MDNKRIKFLNTYLDNVTVFQALSIVEDMIENREKGYVVTPNVDFIIRIEKNNYFAEIVKNATLILTDGKPLIWMSKKLGTPIQEKISGSDFMPQVCKLAQQKGYRIFLLGGQDGVAEQAKSNIEKKLPNINIVGTYSPKYGFENDESEKLRIINLINESEPDILFVCLGSPKQEIFIYQNIDKFNVWVSLAVGAAIDFEAGNIKRAPKWISNIGMEWFYRFCKEPRRLFKRYFIDDMEIFKLYRRYRGK